MHWQVRSDGYRYGFQGQEMDNEVKGEGNSYDFGARLFDSRVGRWLSRDPLEGKYPSLSPYNFVANTPLIAIDPNGKEIIEVIASDEYDGSLKFLNAAFRSMSKNKNTDENKTLVIANQNNFYSEKALKSINRKAKKYGYEVMVVTKQEELVDYFNLDNEGNVHGESRQSDKISSLTIYSHGTPGAIQMNYGPESKDNWNIDQSFVDKIRQPETVFSEDASVTSFACRTGAGVNHPKKGPDTDKSLLYNYAFQREYNGTSSSLAQYMANSWGVPVRSEEHTSELQSRPHLVCRLLLEKKNKK